MSERSRRRYPAPQRAGPERPGPEGRAREGLNETNPTQPELLELLRRREGELEAARAQVAELTEELEATNRGVLALNGELVEARDAEARLAAIVRSAEDAMYALTLDGVVRTWNPGAEHLLGYTAAEIVGRPVDVLVPEEARGELDLAFKQLKAGDHVARHDTWRRRKDGSLVEVSVALSAMHDPAGEVIGYSAVLSDLTERRLAEQELVTARANQELLADRDRIARDLHDLVIQRLFASGMTLQSALMLAERPELASRLTTVIDDLDATILEIRTAIFALGQGLLEATGLRAQLLLVATRTTPILGFQPRVLFEGPVDTLVPADVSEHLLAVAREALSNAARHAHASQVEIVLRAGEDVVLEVIDDGRGMGATTRRSGLGNLRERAESLGGSFTITSETGAGTRLEWRVPAR